MYCLRLFALFWYCKTSTGAQCTRCEEALWGAALRNTEPDSLFENNPFNERCEYLEA